MIKKITCLTILVGVWLLTSFTALAGQFSVSPITMELGPKMKSGVFTVTNSGKDKINFQISVSEWMQDAAGKDVYAETRDIVFFPKIMTVDGGEQRVIRVGFKIPPVLKEKTYRIFIEEIPPPKKREAVGARVTFAIRFAPPIFIMPPRIKTDGVIENISVTKDKISAVVRNTGNVHLRMNSILIKGRSADGAEVFSKEIDGGYVLNNVARRIEVPFPQGKCKGLSFIEIEAKAENINLNGKLDVQKGVCSQ
jgi:fimbrial chaperone protein